MEEREKLTPAHGAHLSERTSSAVEDMVDKFLGWGVPLLTVEQLKRVWDACAERLRREADAHACMHCGARFLTHEALRQHRAAQLDTDPWKGEPRH